MAYDYTATTSETVGLMAPISEIVSQDLKK